MKKTPFLACLGSQTRCRNCTLWER